MARTGKIARLPKNLRDAVNLALQDGATAQAVMKIIADAKAHGATNGDGSEIEVPNDQNVSAWRDGGYQDWLKEQDRLGTMRFNKEAALQIARENEGSKVTEANLAVVASQLYQVLAEFDIDALKEKLVDDPELYLSTLKEVARVAKPSLEFQKYRDLVAEQKRKIEAAITEGQGKGGVTPETLQKIRNELNLL